MTLPRGLRRTFIALAAAALLIAAIVALAPIAVHALTLHYLDRAGVAATIGNVDVNLFTGHVAFDNVTGETENGDGFEIGHLALSLRYPPLLAKRLSLSQLTLQNSTIDIRRTADNTLRVGGVSVLRPEPRNQASLNWGLGLRQLQVHNLRIHYSQPAHGAQPAIDREIRFNDSSARDVATWQPHVDAPMSAAISVGRSRLRLKGKITPFGDQVSGHFELETEHLSLDLLAPLTQRNGLKHLTGTLDSRQQIDIRYNAGKALSITLDGRAAWQKPRLLQSGGLHLASDHLDWQGKIQLKLLRAGGKSGTIHTDGRMQLAGLDAGVGESLSLSQQSAEWQGKTTTTLAAKATRTRTHGTLKSRQVAMAIPGAVDLGSDRMDWRGTTRTISAADGIRFDSDGTLDADKMNFRVPRSASFNAEHINWRGRARAYSARLFSRRARGRLTANNARLSVPDTPVAATAERLVFDGEYAAQPEAGGAALKLSLSGDIDSHAFALMNTAIDAPWLAMRQVHGARLKIDGVDSIALNELTAHGVRILGDTNTSASVISSVKTTARRFRLTDLTHYHLADLDIDGANIHVRRDRSGMGVMTQFFGNSNKSSQPNSGRAGSKTRSTYALDHLSLTGPAVAFTDVAVTPNVKITGSDLNFTLEDLDTASPSRNASYRLSLDIGAYGHLDSRGKIAPLAPEGITMNLDAWLRSLALTPMSGYLNAAMGRRIANGVADGTLHLEATQSQLDGELDTTLANFRLADNPHKETEITLGISMDTALALVRGQDDSINFETAILGDVSNPYFSIKNLVREAVLAGLRTAIMSDYSPLGLLDKAKDAVSDLGRSLASRPALFEPGKHYVRPEDRPYLGRLAQAMREKPGLTLTVRGHAVPRDTDAMSLFQGAQVDRGNRLSLRELAQHRAEAVRDYLAARNVNPERIQIAAAAVDRDKTAQPRTTFSLAGR